MTLDDPKQIKEMQDEIARLTRLVNYDELTGILNRRGLLEDGERMFHFASPYSRADDRRNIHRVPFSVLFIDVDNFKSINDTYGHIAGDNALKLISQIFRTALRADDLYGRFGGEEFVLVLNGVGSDRAMLIAEKLRNAIEQVEFIWKDQRILLTASFGIADHKNETTFLELIGRADHAMYKAKQAGKNMVVVAE